MDHGCKPAFAILTLSVVLLRAFCHFVLADSLAGGLFAKLTISGKTGLLLLPVINEL